jgi:Na+/melibiose symporter-like transporter
MELGNAILLFLFLLAVVIGIFLLIRAIVLWYYKIDERVNNQKEIIRLLTSIRNSLANTTTEKQSANVERKVEN